MKNNIAIARWATRRLVDGFLLFALVCLATTLASPNASAAPNGRERDQVLGVIEKVDSVANTITVRLADGSEKTLQLGKHLTVNGRQETRSRAESALTAQERAVIYYTDKGGDETAVEVASLDHAMRKTVKGTLISADKDKKKLVLRTDSGREEAFRVQNDAVIETGDSVMTFAQFEPQAGAQITLHYENLQGSIEVKRIER